MFWGFDQICICIVFVVAEAEGLKHLFYAFSSFFSLYTFNYY